MKILIVNYHYFIQGGPDRYFFNVKAALEREGHSVVPFAFDYEETWDTPFRGYFPEPITGPGPCLLSKLSLSTWAKAKAVVRMFHNGQVDRRFRAIVQAERPDLVLSIFLADSMLPKILRIAKTEFGLPVIYRLSDFHLFCASHLLFRNGAVCTECLDDPWAAVKHRCVHDSRIASCLRVLQMAHFRHRKWYEAVDTFLCPSQIMADIMIGQGFPAQKIVHLPTFAKDLAGYVPSSQETPRYFLYFGRISPEKGVNVLLDAFNRLSRPQFRLKIVGYCEPSYRRDLLARLDDEHRILTDIVAPQQGQELARTIGKATFVVHPSLCLENMPNTILESLSAGKPIVASNRGSLPELVTDGVNGKLFEAGQPEALAGAIEGLMSSSPGRIETMGMESRRRYEANHTEAVHMRTLGAIMRRCAASSAVCHGEPGRRVSTSRPRLSGETRSVLQ